MGYVPSALQRVIHEDTASIAAVSGGVRAGKSLLLGAEATPHCLIPMKREYLGALIGPTYKEPREEFRYLLGFLADLLPRQQFDPKLHASFPKEGSCELTIPVQRTKDGEVHFATVRTYTAAEIEAIRGWEAEWVMVCEIGGMPEGAFHNIMDRVLSSGGFILGSGTLETSQKWYHNLIKTGLSGGTIKTFKLPSWSNLAAFPGGREDPKIKRMEKLLTEERFLVRLGGEPIRLSGVCIQGANRDTNVKDITFDKTLPVELAIDPGFAGAYAVLAIQQDGENINIIDELYSRFVTTDEIAEHAMKQPWWDSIDPRQAGVIDRAAKQHHSNDSVLERWYEKTGMWFDYIERVVPVDDGIEQLNIFAKMGILRVNPTCRGLLAEWDLGSFPEGFEESEPWHFRANAQGQLVGDRAVKGADHASTALIYWLVNRFGFITPDVLEYKSDILSPMGPRSEFARPVGTDPLGREIEAYGATGGLS